MKPVYVFLLIVLVFLTISVERAINGEHFYNLGEIAGQPTCSRSYCRARVQWQDGTETIEQFRTHTPPVLEERVKKECVVISMGTSKASCSILLLGD